MFANAVIHLQRWACILTNVWAQPLEIHWVARRNSPLRLLLLLDGDKSSGGPGRAFSLPLRMTPGRRQLHREVPQWRSRQQQQFSHRLWGQTSCTHHLLSPWYWTLLSNSQFHTADSANCDSTADPSFVRHYSGPKRLCRLLTTPDESSVTAENRRPKLSPKMNSFLHDHKPEKEMMPVRTYIISGPKFISSTDKFQCALLPTRLFSWSKFIICPICCSHKLWVPRATLNALLLKKTSSNGIHGDLQGFCLFFLFSSFLHIFEILILFGGWG